MYGLGSAFRKSYAKRAIEDSGRVDKTYRGGHAVLTAEGRQLVDAGYMSTSTNIGVAKDFALRDDRNVLQVLFGQSGMPIVSKFLDHEKELLYNRNTKFDVVFDGRNIPEKKIIILSESGLPEAIGHKFDMDLEQGAVPERKGFNTLDRSTDDSLLSY